MLRLRFWLRLRPLSLGPYSEKIKCLPPLRYLGSRFGKHPNLCLMALFHKIFENRYETLFLRPGYPNTVPFAPFDENFRKCFPSHGTFSNISNRTFQIDFSFSPLLCPNISSVYKLLGKILFIFSKSKHFDLFRKSSVAPENTFENFLRMEQKQLANIIVLLFIFLCIFENFGNNFWQSFRRKHKIFATRLHLYL
jgi:hypothetical protein